MKSVEWWNRLSNEQKIKILKPLGIGEIMLTTKSINDLYSKHTVFYGFCDVSKVPAKGLGNR